MCKKEEKEKEVKHRPYISHKINSKWTVDLHVKYKTIKLSEENKRENLDDLGFGDELLETTPKT